VKKLSTPVKKRAQAVVIPLLLLSALGFSGLSSPVLALDDISDCTYDFFTLRTLLDRIRGITTHRPHRLSQPIPRLMSLHPFAIASPTCLNAANSLNANKG
jgi:hypothetical protein